MRHARPCHYHAGDVSRFTPGMMGQVVAPSVASDGGHPIVSRSVGKVIGRLLPDAHPHDDRPPIFAFRLDVDRPAPEERSAVLVHAVRDPHGA